MYDAVNDTEAFAKSSAKLKKFEQNLKNYVSSNNLHIKSDRVQVSGFTKSTSQKATSASKAFTNGANSDIIKDNIRSDIKSGQYPLNINIGNQNKHLVNSHSYNESLKKSILYGNMETAEEIIKLYTSTNNIRLTNNNQWTNKEFIIIDHDIGEIYDKTIREYVTTNKISIHYGKNGTHVVPHKKGE